MLCPECGYMMDAFDKDCVRCHGKGLKKQVVESPVVAPVGNSNSPAPIVPSPNGLPPVVPVSPPQSVVVPASNPFVCVCCGNEGVQKVSAVCNAGAWNSSTNTTTVAHGHVWGGGNFSVAGGSASSGSGASHLAQALSPPAGLELPPFWTLFVGLNFWGGLVFIANDVSGFLAFIVFMAGCFIIYLMIRGRITNSKRRQVQMVTWMKLFYCSRCDNVYNPETSMYASSSNIGALL